MSAAERRTADVGADDHSCFTYGPVVGHREVIGMVPVVDPASIALQADRISVEVRPLPELNPEVDRDSYNQQRSVEGRH